MASLSKDVFVFSSRWEKSFINCDVSRSRGFYSPQSESRTAAALGRAVCLSGPTPSSPPSYIRRRRPESPRLSSGSLWRTAPLWISSLPASPVLEQHGSKVKMKQNIWLKRSNWYKVSAPTLPKLPFPSRARKLKSLSRTRSRLPEGKLKRRWSDGVITFLPWPSLAFCRVQHTHPRR